MRENTTRDPKIGQDNGMWGMKKIVNNNIASSFADEFIGKLLQECGFIQFNNLIRITNISKENMSIINRSVMQRISEND